MDARNLAGPVDLSRPNAVVLPRYRGDRPCRALAEAVANRSETFPHQCSTTSPSNWPLCLNGASRSSFRRGTAAKTIRRRSSIVISPSSTISPSTALAWSMRCLVPDDPSSLRAGCTTVRRPPGRSSLARNTRKSFQSSAPCCSNLARVGSVGAPPQMDVGGRKHVAVNDLPIAQGKTFGSSRTYRFWSASSTSNRVLKSFVGWSM
jgi:hypothetical protein